MLLCGVENCRQAPLFPEARNKSKTVCVCVCGRDLLPLVRFNSSAGSVMLWIRVSTREQLRP